MNETASTPTMPENMMCQKSPRRAAFSLTELLVVLAIIALLVALLLPMISRGLANGKAAACLSNVRQMHQFAQTRVNDTGRYPHMARQFFDSDGNLRNDISDNFYTLLGDEPAAGCPKAKFRGRDQFGRVIQSYGSNPMVMGFDRADNPQKQVKEAMISRPMDIILMADCAQFNDATRRVLPYSLAWWPDPWSGDPDNAEEPLTEEIIPAAGFWDDIPLMPRRHSGRANLVFVDGHGTSVTGPGDLREENYYWNY